MAKIKEFVKKHKKEIILVGAGVAVGAGVTYVVCKKTGIGMKKIKFDPSELYVGVDNQKDNAFVCIGMLDTGADWGVVIDYSPEAAKEIADRFADCAKAIMDKNIPKELLFFKEEVLV